MKIKTVDHFSGTFRNYLGIDQHFDIALVSYIPDFEWQTVASCDKYISFLNAKIVMGIGTAFCRPTTATEKGDEYDPELGKQIAIAHATSPRKAFCTITQTQMGFINEQIRKSILNNLIKNVQEEPERFSESYRKAKEKFERSNESEKVWKDLTQNEQTCVNVLAQSNQKTIDKINYLLANFD